MQDGRNDKPTLTPPPASSDLISRSALLRGETEPEITTGSDWNAGEIDMLLAHPASCAYGLNLQQGGRHIVWFGLNWSLELYQQANKRLHRQGQTLPVIVHRLVVQGGMDEDVVRSLSEKADVQGSLLEALKARIRKVKEDNS